LPIRYEIRYSLVLNLMPRTFTVNVAAPGLMEVYVSEAVVTVEVFDMPTHTSCYSGG